jgi:hypothetical protein
MRSSLPGALTSCGMARDALHLGDRGSSPARRGRNTTRRRRARRHDSRRRWARGYPRVVLRGSPSPRERAQASNSSSRLAAANWIRRWRRHGRAPAFAFERWCKSTSRASHRRTTAGAEAHDGGGPRPGRSPRGPRGKNVPSGFTPPGVPAGAPPPSRVRRDMQSGMMGEEHSGDGARGWARKIRRGARSVTRRGPDEPGANVARGLGPGSPEEARDFCPVRRGWRDCVPTPVCPYGKGEQMRRR